MSVNEADLKKLYALAAGRCSICKQNVFANEVHIGEMAHVIAKKTKGARGNQVVVGDINGYVNLILLCRNHHSEVDQNEEKYSVGVLHRIKDAHENWIQTSLPTDDNRNDDEKSLSYLMKFIPFTSLASYTYHLPRSFDVDFLSVGDMMDAFMLDRPHGYPFSNVALQETYEDYLNQYYALQSKLVGETNGKPNFLSADMVGNRMISRRNKAEFSYQENVAIDNEIASANSNFDISYRNLIGFLRHSYPRIKLDSFI